MPEDLVKLSGKQVQHAGSAGRYKPNTWRSHSVTLPAMNPVKALAGWLMKRGLAVAGGAAAPLRCYRMSGAGIMQL